MTVYNSKFINNKVSGSVNADGAAIYNNGTTSIVNSRFEGNGSTTTGGSESGGAIENNRSGAILAVENSDFVNNTAGAYGGAIANTGGTMTIENSNFENIIHNAEEHANGNMPKPEVVAKSNGLTDKERFAEFLAGKPVTQARSGGLTLFGDSDEKKEETQEISKVTPPEPKHVTFEKVNTNEQPKQEMPRTQNSFAYNSRLEIDDSDLPPFLRKNFKKDGKF